MKAYFLNISEEEKKSITEKHREIYDGYQTVQPKGNNMTPLKVENLAQDDKGITLNNKKLKVAPPKVEPPKVAPALPKPVEKPVKKVVKKPKTKKTIKKLPSPPKAVKKSSPPPAKKVVKK